MFYIQKNGKITVNKNGTMPKDRKCGCCATNGSSSASCFEIDCPPISQLHVPPFFTEVPLTDEKPGINTCKVHINGQIYQVDCISSYAEFDDDGFEGGKIWYAEDDLNPLYEKRETYWDEYQKYYREYEELKQNLDDAIISDDPDAVNQAREDIADWELNHLEAMNNALSQYNSAKHKYNLHTIDEAGKEDICAVPFIGESVFRDSEKKVKLTFKTILQSDKVRGFSLSGEDCTPGSAKHEEYSAFRSAHYVTIETDKDELSAVYVFYSDTHVLLTGIDTSFFSTAA